MKKYTLPLLLSSNLVLLPHNRVRLEFIDNSQASNIIDLSELFHENLILFATLENQIGTLAKIKSKLKLPNSIIRVELEGVKRVNIIEFIKDNDTPVEAVVCDIKETEIDENIKETHFEKVKLEYNKHLKTLSKIDNDNHDALSLSDFIDKNVLKVTNDINNLLNILNELDVIKKAEQFLIILNKETLFNSIDRKIDIEIKNNIDDTQKKYYLKEKIKLLKKELDDEEPLSKTDILKDKIEKLKCSLSIKKKLKHEMNRFENSPTFSQESSMIKEYLDVVTQIPFNKFTKDSKDLKQIIENLDNNHFGLEEVKERIIEYLAVKQKSNNLKSPIICLVGPPGVGKSSLAKSIATSINRKFVKISVGGLSDEFELMGHRRTYVGAMPGRIIKSLNKAGCMNPVLLIDEVDKMGVGKHNNPASSLLAILDYEQNKNFSDNYVEEDIDLSNIMFILTANYIEDIPLPLLDRLEIIELSSYTIYEKIDIVKNHLLKQVKIEHGLEEEVKIKDEVIEFIIKCYTKEAGVRELKRQLEKIFRKVVKESLLNKKNSKSITLTKDKVISYLKSPRYIDSKVKYNEAGIINGLAYTKVGGSLLQIEVLAGKYKSNLILTGSLGDVLKESAQIAYSYIKKNHLLFSISKERLDDDLHIHLPEGAVKKDGPSAGVALTLAIISSLTGKKVSSTIAMTGEITLSGKVLPIGGLKEKSIAAYNNGIKKIYIPKLNEKDIEQIPDLVKENVEIVLVDKFIEVYKQELSC